MHIGGPIPLVGQNISFTFSHVQGEHLIAISALIFDSGRRYKFSNFRLIMLNEPYYQNTQENYLSQFSKFVTPFKLIYQSSNLCHSFYLHVYNV